MTSNVSAPGRFTEMPSAIVMAGFSAWVRRPPSTDSFIEGTAAQYRFVVPFNQPAEARLLGGNAATNALLDSFFTTMDGSNGNQSFLANEFDLGTPWFYNWTGAPSHTQSVVNRMLTTLYKDTPSGFPNNDDLGTMSSQYVWGALGMYPVTPGSGDLMFNSPIFTQAVVHLPSGGTMTINAPAASASNIYVQSLNVNGSASTATWMSATAARAALAYGSAASPAAVNRTVRRDRSSSGCPSSRSSRWIWALTAGCATWMRRAARVKLASSATATKYSSCRNSIADDYSFWSKSILDL